MRSAIGLVLLFTIAAVVAVVAAPVPPPRSLAGGVLFTPAACSSAPFSDVAANHPYCSWIQQLKDDQVSAGCGDGKFCPDEPVTRQHFAMLLEKAMRGTPGWDPWRGNFERTLIVRAVPNNPSAAGQRLLAVVASIDPDDLPSSSSPYLVLVEPGTYDIDDQPLVVPNHVTLRGAGRNHTQINAQVSGGAIRGGGNTVIESLSVLNINPPANQAIGVEILPGTGIGTVRNVFALGSSGNITSVGIRCASDCVIEDSEARAVSGPSSNYGIRITGAETDAVLRRVTAAGTGGFNAYGVSVEDGTLRLEGGLLDAKSGDVNAALHASAAAVTARDFEADAGGAEADDSSAGVRVQSGATMTIQNGVLASAFLGSRYGLHCQGGTVDVYHSRLVGADATVLGHTDCSIDVAGSQLAGLAVDENGGTVRCALNYSENLNVPATTGCF